MRRGLLESLPSPPLLLSCDDDVVATAVVLAIGLMAVPRLRLVAAVDIATDGGRFGGMMK